MDRNANKGAPKMTSEIKSLVDKAQPLIYTGNKQGLNIGTNNTSAKNGKQQTNASNNNQDLFNAIDQYQNLKQQSSTNALAKQQQTSTQIAKRRQSNNSSNNTTVHKKQRGGAATGQDQLGPPESANVKNKSDLVAMFSDMLPTPSVKLHSRKLEGDTVNKDTSLIQQKSQRNEQIMKDYMQNNTFQNAPNQKQLLSSSSITANKRKSTHGKKQQMSRSPSQFSRSYNHSPSQGAIGTSTAKNAEVNAPGATFQKSRQSKSKNTVYTKRLVQIEPNPIFSLIDEKMETINKHQLSNDDVEIGNQSGVSNRNNSGLQREKFPNQNQQQLQESLHMPPQQDPAKNNEFNYLDQEIRYSVLDRSNLSNKSNNSRRLIKQQATTTTSKVVTTVSKEQIEQAFRELEVSSSMKITDTGSSKQQQQQQQQQHYNGQSQQKQSKQKQQKGSHTRGGFGRNTKLNQQERMSGVSVDRDSKQSKQHNHMRVSGDYDESMKGQQITVMQFQRQEFIKQLRRYNFQMEQQLKKEQQSQKKAFPDKILSPQSAGLKAKTTDPLKTNLKNKQVTQDQQPVVANQSQLSKVKKNGDIQPKKNSVVALTAQRDLGYARNTVRHINGSKSVLDSHGAFVESRKSSVSNFNKNYKTQTSQGQNATTNSNSKIKKLESNTTAAQFLNSDMVNVLTKDHDDPTLYNSAKRHSGDGQSQGSMSQAANMVKKRSRAKDLSKSHKREMHGQLQIVKSKNLSSQNNLCSSGSKQHQNQTPHNHDMPINTENGKRILLQDKKQLMSLDQSKLQEATASNVNSKGTAAGQSKFRVSTSIKSTWTVNKTSANDRIGQPQSQLTTLKNRLADQQRSIVNKNDQTYDGLGEEVYDVQKKKQNIGTASTGHGAQHSILLSSPPQVKKKFKTKESGVLASNDYSVQKRSQSSLRETKSSRPPRGRNQKFEQNLSHQHAQIQAYARNSDMLQYVQKTQKGKNLHIPLSPSSQARNKSNSTTTKAVQSCKARLEGPGTPIEKMASTQMNMQCGQKQENQNNYAILADSGRHYPESQPQASSQFVQNNNGPVILTASTKKGKFSATVSRNSMLEAKTSILTSKNSKSQRQQYSLRGQSTTEKINNGLLIDQQQQSEQLSLKIRSQKVAQYDQKLHFEQLMTAGSNFFGNGAKRLTPIKIQKTQENGPVEGQNGLTSSQSQSNPQLLRAKNFIYSDTGIQIGNGKFGPVKLIIHRGKFFALKIIPKASVNNSKRIEHVKNEKEILHLLKKGDNDDESFLKIRYTRSARKDEANRTQFDQRRQSQTKQIKKEPLDFIVKLHETFVDADNINFVFEYLPGQDLFWILANENSLDSLKGNSSSKNARKDWVLFYCSEILCALSVLHTRKIIYRDMKPDNVMIDSEGHIKLIDFGFSKLLEERTNFRTRTNCGTIGYTAPEVILGVSQGFSFPVDIWSFGVMLAELLSGSLPFQEKDDPMKLQEQIVAGQLKLNKQGIDFIAKDLLNSIFKSDPEMRPSIDKIKKHRLFIEAKPADYWQLIETKKFQEVPYKPDPQKYQKLLGKEYPMISSADKPQPNSAQQQARATTSSSSMTNDVRPATQGASNTSLNDRAGLPVTDQSCGANSGLPSAIPKIQQAAPSVGCPLPLPPATKKVEKVTIRDKIPPNFMERELNVGLFGRGGGDFDATGNMRGQSPMLFTQPDISVGSTTSAAGVGMIKTKKPKNLLGDFTIYRVNKEFENF